MNTGILILVTLMFVTSGCSLSQSPLRPSGQLESRVLSGYSAIHDVGGFQLRLAWSSTDCRLEERNGNDTVWNSRSLGMRGPCEFIHLARSDKPQTVTIGQNRTRRIILMVIGGPPHPVHRDPLMPDGCGTVSARVFVYSHHIAIDPADPRDLELKIEPDALCPSYPRDEVFFVTG